VQWEQAEGGNESAISGGGRGGVFGREGSGVSNMISYEEFLSAKSQIGQMDGFEPIWMPDFLFDFQKSLVDWAIRKGRAAVNADCGLGKTPMQLVWAQNIVEKTNKPSLILTPLAVSYQTCREADKFGIDCKRSTMGEITSKVVTTNYERLHYFDASKFGGVVCDESSILKNFSGRIKAAVTEFMREIPYRLLCTATAAPNDFVELGTSSEALGYLGYTDMITRFFKEQISKDYLGWGRKTYEFRGHAEGPFWKWVCSWARACRKPSDLGFADNDFILPDLIEREVVVRNCAPRSGMLFSIVAASLQEQREERRITINDRCAEAAAIAHEHGGPSVLWCHLNEEGDRLEEIVSDSKQVSGSMEDDKKEEYLLAFQAGQIKRLITKPKIGCFGLNWQHCDNVVTFPSHSFEQYYQTIRRCWRFGQKKPVKVSIVTTEGEQRVLDSLKRKSLQADRMFDALVANMNEAIRIDDGWKFTEEKKVPAWLS
jgi:hypothetical protein